MSKTELYEDEPGMSNAARLHKEYSSSEIRQQWIQNYVDDPSLYFKRENLDSLKEMSSEQRLALTAYAANYLKNSNKNAKIYFETFPEDLKQVAQIYQELAGNKQEYMLYVILIGFFLNELENSYPEIFDTRAYPSYREIATRRGKASDLIMEGYEYKFYRSFEEFGTADQGLRKAIDEVYDLNILTSRQIDAGQIFNVGFENLNTPQQVSFICKAIKEIHFRMLHSEVYDFHMTENQIMEDKIKRAELLAKNDLLGQRMDPFHSMIYSTYHPIRSYQQTEKQIKEYMKDRSNLGELADEYPFQRIMLVLMNKLYEMNLSNDSESCRKAVKTLVDLAEKSKNPIFWNAIEKTVKKLDLEFAHQILIENISDEKVDKRPLNIMIENLEGGQINLEDNRLHYFTSYLDFDQDINSDVFYVKRISCNHKFGIFRKDNNFLESYFEFDHRTISSGQKITIRKIEESQIRITPEEKGSSIEELELFKEGYMEARDEVYKYLGVDISNLPLQEQTQFITLFKKSDEALKVRLKRFAAVFGEEGIRVFTSLEIDQGAGDVILKLSEDDETFSFLAILKFNEGLNLAQISDEDLSRDFFNNDRVIHPHANILKQSYGLLKKYQKEVSLLREEDRYSKIEEFIEELNDVQDSEILFNSMFYTASRSPEGITFGEVKKTTFRRKVKMSDIEPEYKQKMREVYIENHPLGDGSLKDGLVTCSEDYRDYLISNFDELLKRDDVEAYDFRGKVLNPDTGQYEDVPLAFMFFEYIRDENGDIIKKKAWSFNVNNKYRTSGIGQQMMKEAFHFEVNLPDGPEGTKPAVETISVLQNRVSKKYIERDGFVAIGHKEFESNQIMNILWDEEIIKHSKAKKLTPEEVKALPEGQKSDELLMKKYAKGQFIDLSPLDQNYDYMSRFFEDEHGDTYCVFEKKAA